jgi:hypothetical protein
LDDWQIGSTMNSISVLVLALASVLAAQSVRPAIAPVIKFRGVAQPSDLGALPRLLIVRAHHQNSVPRFSRSLRRAGTMLSASRVFHTSPQKEIPPV